MSNPYLNYRGDRPTATSLGGSTNSAPPPPTAATPATQKDAKYPHLSLAGLNGLQQTPSAMPRSALSTQHVWASDQPAASPPSLLPQVRSTAPQASRSLPLNGGSFSLGAGRNAYATFNAGTATNDLSTGLNPNPSDAFLAMNKGMNAATTSEAERYKSTLYGPTSHNAAVFDPSEFPSLGGGLGGESSDMRAMRGAGSKAMNGYGNYADLYNLGSGYGSGRAKAVDALTANPNGPGFSMQKEDFPALGGGLAGNLGRAVGGSLGTSLGSVAPLSSSLNTNGLIGSHTRLEEQQNGTSEAYLRRPVAAPSVQPRQQQHQLPQQVQEQQIGRGDSSRYTPSSANLSVNAPTSISTSVSPDVSPERASQGTSRPALPSRGSASALNGLNAYSQGAPARRLPFTSASLQRSQGRTLDADQQGPYDQSIAISTSPSSELASYSNTRSMQLPSLTTVQAELGSKGSSPDSVSRVKSKSVGTRQGGDTELIGGSPSKANSALPEDQYGMKGLLKVLTPNNEGSEIALLSLGLDLTMLGLDLNSSNPLHHIFESPWIDSKDEIESGRGSGLRNLRRARQSDLEKRLPKCYYMQPPALKTSHFSKFALESLFYIFYSMPRDILQLYAAAELYKHQWRYHKDLKLWFTRSRSPGPMPTLDRNGYIYFDISVWEKRPFTDANASFAQGFLTEEEIRSQIKQQPGMK